MSEEPLLHVIYTEDEVFLSRRQYDSWRDIQDECPSYKASLGPWSVDEVIDYLGTDYAQSLVDPAEQTRVFLASGLEAAVLRFA